MEQLCLVHFSASKTKLRSFNHQREVFLPFISIADVNLQGSDSLSLLGWHEVGRLDLLLRKLAHCVVLDILRNLFPVSTSVQFVCASNISATYSPGLLLYIWRFLMKFKEKYKHAAVAAWKVNSTWNLYKK